MQLKCWWLIIALLLIQLIRNFLCVEPITVTVGAAAGVTTLTCKDVF